MNRHGIVTTIAVGRLMAWGSIALLAAPAEAAPKQRTHYAASRAYDGLWSVSISSAVACSKPTMISAIRFPARWWRAAPSA